ncbi:MAG: hypothetical protein HUJ52_02880, partial [Malacoplasma sp.]|nr:hypothetical protein [Malacoplasma sp.]
EGQTVPGVVDGVPYADESIFKAYDFSQDTSEDVSWMYTMSCINKYGAISQLGLMSQEFLTYYVYGSYNQVFYGDSEDSWTENYKSKMDASSTPYIVYTNMLFNYSGSGQVAPGIYVAIYLILAFIFMSVAYVRFVKYDFK